MRYCILIPPVAILPNTPVASSRSQIHKSITLAILWRARPNSLVILLALAAQTTLVALCSIPAQEAVHVRPLRRKRYFCGGPARPHSCYRVMTV